MSTPANTVFGRKTLPGHYLPQFFVGVILVASVCHAQTPKTDKTLVSWVTLVDKSVRAGTVLTVQVGTRFDGIVFAEKDANKWIGGSDGFQRTQKVRDQSAKETADGETLVQMAIVYHGNRISIYRNTELYASYEASNIDLLSSKENVAVFGLRHLGGNGSIAGSIEDARIYDRALTADEIRGLKPNQASALKPYAWWDFEGEQVVDRTGQYTHSTLEGGAKLDGGKLVLVRDAALVAARTKEMASTSTKSSESSLAEPVILGTVKMKKDTQGRRPFHSPVNYSPCTGDCITFYENGNYHLLMLNKGGWDHFKSKDLVNWETLKPVLDKGKPDETDGEWCFTGHIMEHEGTFHIFYPGVNRKHPRGNMCMMHATSKGMVNFTKHPERTWWPDGIHYKTKAQSDHHGSVEHPMFKDQFVIWNEKEQKWWMFFSGEAIGVEGSSCALATSDDLITWKQVPPIKGLATGDCTDVFKFGDWWYRTSGVTWWRAKDLAGPWSHPQRFESDYWVVPKGMWDGKRRISIGGLRNLYATLDYSDLKNVHVCSIPREIYVDADGDLMIRPVQEVIDVFSKTVLDLKTKPEPVQRFLPRTWEPADKGTVGWKYEADTLVNWNAQPFERARCSFEVPTDYMVEATVEMEHHAEFVMIFHQNKDQADSGYRLSVNKRTGEGSITGPTSTFPRRIKLDPHKPVTIRAFVNESLMECFINDAFAFSYRGREYEGGQLGLESSMGGVKVVDLKVKTAR